ncbi:hypothetical protein M3Y97_00409900 [Aphelenchoides bicaudatus]|nr:hypothetical protein M3Y97_00409900 [Aphelenchoides bicaudatus]
MKWINLAEVFLTVTLVFKSVNCVSKNEINVLRASGDVAHSLLEMLANGRMGVDENQSHLTALRARLQNHPQQSAFPFNEPILNKVASSLDEVSQVSDNQMIASSTPATKHSDELNFVEDTDEKNFVTEPYPPKPKSRQWMINRMIEHARTTTTTSPPPTTTQFTLFPTFPTLFPPLFALTPMSNPFTLPTISTPGPIFNLPSTTAQSSTSSTTQQPAVERRNEPKIDPVIDSKSDLDLLKPYRPESKIPNHRTKVVGSRLQFKLGEKMNKQDGEDNEGTSDQPTTVTENPESESPQTDNPDGETSNATEQQHTTTDKPESEDETTQPSTNSASNPSTDDDTNQTTQTPNPNDDGSGKASGSTQRPDNESGTPQPKASGEESGDNGSASGSGSGKTTDGDPSGNPSGSSTKCTDGRWSEWKIKFPCSSECGACGRVQKERECLSFKNGKGCPCTGDYKVIEPCQIEVCRYPKPSCCPPFDLIHVDGVFACGPQQKHIMAEFKNSTRFRKH